MTEATIESIPEDARRPRKIRFDLVGKTLFRPRQAFRYIASLSTAVWLTPLLILSLAALANVVTSGYLKQLAAQSGEVQLPPDFQYYSPEMQEQFMQAVQATSGPAFNYVLPGLSALIMVWGGWLVVGGLLHLVLTVLGGRGDTTLTLNLVAWAGLPFALRDLVRTVAMLIGRDLITSPGLSGFINGEPTSLNLYWLKLLGLVDIYLIWHVILLGIGSRTMGELTARKAWLGVLLTMIVLTAIEALALFGLARLGSLQLMRPFFF